MKKLPKIWALATTVVLLHTASHAQTAPQGADGAIQATNSIVQMIDQNRSADVWDSAAAGAKAAVPRNVFIGRINEIRTALGPPKSRSWKAVKRQTVPAGAQAPAGRYMSVEYDTVFGADKPAQELVTFRLEEDGTWRFMGYAVEPVATAATAKP